MSKKETVEDPKLAKILEEIKINPEDSIMSNLISKIINRPEIDYDCPVDLVVINVIHEYAESKKLDKKKIAADITFKALQLIRKDVLKSKPEILKDCLFTTVIDAEIV